MKREKIVEDLNEAISLLIMFNEKGMITYIDSKSNEYFSDNTPKMYGLHEPEHNAAAFLDYFDVNTWQLLNSFYYLSNSFKDFCKDFKTIEQRRHELELKIAKRTLTPSWIAAIFAVLSLIISMISLLNTYQIIK